MSIGGSIKHAFHHAAHQVEHGAKHAADKVSHEAKHDAHDAGKVAEQTAGDAAHAAGQGVSAIVDQVESSIESGVGAAVPEGGLPVLEGSGKNAHGRGAIVRPDPDLLHRLHDRRPG